MGPTTLWRQVRAATLRAAAAPGGPACSWAAAGNGIPKVHCASPQMNWRCMAFKNTHFALSAASPLVRVPALSLTSPSAFGARHRVFIVIYHILAGRKQPKSAVLQFAASQNIAWCLLVQSLCAKLDIKIEMAYGRAPETGDQARRLPACEEVRSCWPQRVNGKPSGPSRGANLTKYTYAIV